MFGLGEAGGAIAADLAVAGADVRAYDPLGIPTPAGVTRAPTPDEAVSGAEFICALTAGADAMGALAQALAAIEPSAVYADFATAAAGLKRELAAVAGARGIAFADIALMAAVPGNGLRTPALASGSGAARFAEAFVRFGMPVEACGAEAGYAATRKLLRSIVMKGLAGVVIESMRAADAAGLAGETWQNIVEQITAADETFLRRIVDGTFVHSLRRLHEMQAASDLLVELGVPPLMTTATVASLQAIEDGSSSAVRLPLLRQ